MRTDWRTYTHNEALICPICDDQIEVLTTLSPTEILQGIYEDGNIVRCIDKRCRLYNAQIICDEKRTYVAWD